MPYTKKRTNTLTSNSSRNTTRKRPSSYTLSNFVGSIMTALGNQPSINTQNKSRKFRSLQCSPIVINTKRFYNISSHTCYPTHVLRNLYTAWNKHYPNDPIPECGDVDELYKILKAKLRKICFNEKCWSRKLNMPTDNKLYFAPNRPIEWETELTTWLSNIDIWNVLKQYEVLYTYFKCIYPTPVNYNTIRKDSMTCVSEELCKFNLAAYIKTGITKIGVVINTDPHYKKGAHWIALFINIPNKVIFFFDSGGDKCPRRLYKLITSIIAQGKELDINLTFDQNHPLAHQRSTTECGMYVMYFIINMITDNITPYQLKTHRIPDDKMIKLRNKYFTKNV